MDTGVKTIIACNDFKIWWKSESTRDIIPDEWTFDRGSQIYELIQNLQV